MQRLEAILFLAREPLSTRNLGRLAGLADGTEARSLAAQLNRLYDQRGRAFRIGEVAGGMQLLTHVCEKYDQTALIELAASCNKIMLSVAMWQIWP